MLPIEKVFFIVVQGVNNIGREGMAIDSLNDVLVASVQRLVKRPRSGVKGRMQTVCSLTEEAAAILT